ncbi:MAG: hypothetical protein ACYDCK_07110 [Thermoplasmatota archaeon]
MPSSDALRRRAALVGIVGLGVALRLWNALTQDTLKDGYHQWWIAARFLRTGALVDPFANQVGARWLPGYQVFAAGILALAGPHALPALRLVNVALAGASILLVARLAERLSPGAGLPAALLYALAPWELITSARSMAESPAWLLALIASNLLLAPPSGAVRWRWLGGVALALACLFRYEAWLLAALFAVRALAPALRSPTAARRSELAPLAPSFAVGLGWIAVSAAWTHGFFGSAILAAGRAEATYHESVGLYPASPIVRVLEWLAFYVVPVAALLALAVVAAVRAPRRFVVLVPLAFFAAVVILLAASASDGSPRYLGMATPFVAVLAGESLVALRKRLARRTRASVVAFALVAILLAQGALTAAALANEPAGAIYEAPAMRAGQWIAAHPPPNDTLVVSESPSAAYWSDVAPERLIGSMMLPPDRDAALTFMRAHVSYVVYENDSLAKYPYYRLNAMFPELVHGRSTANFTLIDDPNGWERQYGAREVYVYAVRE